MTQQNSLAIACFVLLTIVGLGSRDRATAQVALPTCLPPQSGELLLLVATPTSDARELLRRGLPESIEINICQYREIVTSRIGGFENANTANRWGRYINDILRLQLSIARLPGDSTGAVPQTPPPATPVSPPPATPVSPPPATPVSPSPATPVSPSPLTSAYNPRALGAGYAVIIDHFNNPEIATQVQQLLGRDIGLVSYFSRPYLLVGQTQDQQQAAFLLQQLSDRGFAALMVNSRQTILLTPKVSNP